MGLQVIGAGLGRTGTNSLKVALEQLLGGTCYHMFEVRQRPDHVDIWADAYEGRQPAWHELFDPFTATVDWPSSPFWREQSDAYPEAIILLSVRHEDAWWKSASETILPGIAQCFEPDAEIDSRVRMFRAMIGAFTPDFLDERAAKDAYLRHNDSVRNQAPADRLVEWSPGDGWEPICRALGLAVPDVAFPHVNSTAEFQQHVLRRGAPDPDAHREGAGTPPRTP